MNACLVVFLVGFVASTSPGEPLSKILKTYFIIKAIITSIYGIKAEITIVWNNTGAWSIYHYLPKSVYYLLIGIKYSSTGVYSKLALVNKPRIAVLKKQVTKMTYMIFATLSDSVSYPMKSIKAKVKVLTMMFTTETKIVTTFDNIRLVNFKSEYYLQFFFQMSFSVLFSLKILVSWQ